MKALILAVLASLSTSAFAYSPEAVKNAQDFLASIEDQFKVGEVTRADVDQAKAYLLEMKLEAGQIALNDYCKEVLPKLEAIIEAIEEEAKVGMRTTGDILEARKSYYKTKKFCGR